MDFLPALPPDLVALADPAARGPAPLLASAGSEDVAALGTTPFALALALLTNPLPSGEPLPSAGNELPTLPLEATPDSDSAPSPADLLFALAPAAAAVQAQLRPAEPLPGVLPTAAAVAAPVLPAADTESATPTLPAALAVTAEALAPEPAIAPAGQTQTSTALEPAKPFEAGAAPDESGLAFELGESLARDAAAQPAAEAPSFDDLLAADRRFERLVAQRAEPRANSLIEAPPQPTAVPQYQAAAAPTTPSAEVGAVTQSAARRVDLSKVVPASTSADASGVAQADWLPAASGAGTTSHAVAPAAQSAPGTPVDTRTPTWHEAFASRVQWLVDHNVGEAHIKLNPPELGAVDVKISLVDDKTFVQLTTATAAARDELSHSLPRLRELFTASGLELGGASVQGGRDGQQSAYGQQGHGPGQGQAQNQGAGASEPRWPASFSTAADELPRGLPRSSLGRIDVFA